MRPLVAAFGLAVALAGQTAPAPRLSAQIDNGLRVAVRASVPAQLGVARSLGAASPALPVARLLLVLRRSPAQETALRQFLGDQQDPASPRYHRWLTPGAFGDRFGVSQADISVISAWLASRGLTVSEVAPGRTLIEAGGTAAALQAAFGTRLWRYRWQSRDYLAGHGPVTIPAALANVLAGPLSLSSFPKTAAPAPAFNQAPLGAGGVTHELAPADVAKIYNFGPLYAQGLDGAGASVAVVGRSDFPAYYVEAFRQVFLPSFPQDMPRVVINGPDPGVSPYQAETNEATLDAEWAGALAPAASEYFVVSQSTAVTDGTDLSAEYIVDHALAPIMSNSFGQCEALLGGPGSAANLFYQNLYEQAAAEGITVVVSSGDSGSAGCDPPGAPAGSGLGVNGLASTPFDLAIGGTSFRDSPADWANSNDPTNMSSVLGYLPEVVWNDSCAGCGTIAASGGGASEIYPKPAWQGGPGVPADGARDLPDLALAAGSAVPYVLGTPCGVGGAAPCPPGSPGDVGGGIDSIAYGTSAAAQALAGALALIIQKTGSWQGLINPELYRLAAAQPAGVCSATGTPEADCIFNDVTQGTNAVACQAGTSSCVNGVISLSGGTPAYPAGPGYDLATGLGTPNFANLLAAWPTATPTATATTLQASAQTVTHGQVVQLTVGVSSLGPGPTPAGVVEILAGSEPGSTVLGTSELRAGEAVLALNDLPGGEDSIVARFAGLGAFQPSVSAPVTVSVSREASDTQLSVFQGDGKGNWTPVSNTYFGAPLALVLQIAGQSGVADGAGTVSLTQDGAGLGGGPLSLNASGGAGTLLGVLGLGRHTFAASFSGDAGLLPSSTAANLTVAPAATTTTVQAPIISGSDGKTIKFNLAAAVDSANVEAAGTGFGGTVAFTDASGAVILTAPAHGQPSPFAPIDHGGGGATVTLPARPIEITARYSGDGNFLASDSPPISLDGGSFHFEVNGPSAATVVPGGSATFSLTAVMDSPLANPVALTCPGGGGVFTCTLSSTSLHLSPANPQANITVTVSLSTNLAAGVPPQSPALPRGNPILVLGALVLLLVLGCCARRRLRPFALALALAMAAGCGGSPQITPPPPPSPLGISIQGKAGYDYNWASLTVTGGQ